MVQLSHPCMATGKITALTMFVTFVTEVTSLLFHTLSLSQLFFQGASSFNFMAAVTAVVLELKKVKSVTVSTFPPSVCHEVMELDAMLLVF